MSDSPDILAILRTWVGNSEAPTHSRWLVLIADMKDAIAEIERLRLIAGAVSSGPSLAELRATLPNRDPHPER